jgi:hypothetical protein
MEPEAKVFDSFEEAERAEAEYYASLTPKERVDILLDLVENYRRSLGPADRFERVCRVTDLQES